MTTPTLPYDFPLTPLDTLRRKIGYDAYLFWGMSNSKVLNGSVCNNVIYEYSWQHANQIGRSEMREAILEAEMDIRRECKFSVAPHYAQETVDYLQISTLGLTPLYSPTQFGQGDPTSRWTDVQLSEGYVQSLGYEDLQLIDNVEVVLTDNNNDGLIDTFTLEFNSVETNPLNIAVYYPPDERLDDAPVGEEWRINPVSVKIEAGNVTVTGRSWLIVKPILYQKATLQNALDPDDLNIYCANLAVYRRTTNPNGQLVTNCQATFIWETIPLPAFWWLCPPSPTNYSTDPAAEGFAIGRCGIRNAKAGLVIPGQAIYNEESEQWIETFPLWNWRPDRVLVRYFAGYPLDSMGQINADIREAVVQLAIADMPERICACDIANKQLHYLQWDMSRVGNNLEQYATTRGQLNNIFGTRRGQINAWKKLQHKVLHRGVHY